MSVGSRGWEPILAVGGRPVVLRVSVRLRPTYFSGALLNLVLESIIGLVCTLDLRPGCGRVWGTSGGWIFLGPGLAPLAKFWAGPVVDRDLPWVLSIA
jgi:hypothetical protein